MALNTHIYGTPIDSAFRPDLIRFCREELGHNYEKFLKFQGVEKLRELARNGEAFVPKPKGSSPATVPQATVPTTTPAKAGNATGALLEAIAADIAPIIVDQVTATLQDRFDQALSNRPTEIVIKFEPENIPAVNLGTCHELTPELIELLIIGDPLWVTGPAGSGKTHALMTAAKTLSEIKGRPFKVHVVPGHRDLTADHILGYRNIVDGSVIRTPAREAYEHGGILLIDEIDRCPSVLTALNMMIENGHCGFPDGLITKHPDFICVASANTCGQGATQHYAAAELIDGATLNRFAFLPWHYDERLERALAGPQASAWVDRVIALRRALLRLGHAAPNLIISPRASIRGAKHLAKFPHVTFEKLEERYIWQGCNEDDKAKIINQVGK